MGNELPLVSVLMTAYNREKYIAGSIESVLSSSYKNFELIIVDDFSSDKTVEIAKGYEQNDSRIRVYVNKKNLGDYPNRNKAASYAKGKYLKYLDSDDIMYAYCLDAMVSAMEEFPEAGFGLSSVADPFKPYPDCISPHDIYLEHFNGYGHFDRAPGSSIIKRESFEMIGGFTGERMIGDYQLWLTLARRYEMVKMPRDLVWDRQHPEQESKTDYAKLYNKLKKKVLTDALIQPECPLTEKEKEKALASLNNHIVKRVFRKIKKL